MMIPTFFKLSAPLIIIITLLGCGGGGSGNKDNNVNQASPSVNVSQVGEQLRLSWEDQNAARYVIYYGEENTRPSIAETTSTEVFIDPPEIDNLIITVEAYDTLGNTTFLRREVQL